jgi:AcrR family transcriptional regulator
VTAKRPVGRPRQFEDAYERTLILEAAYGALRDLGHEFTVASILAQAGVSTRSFYRHFESKDALLCAMYLRDAEWAAARLAKRVADAVDPADALRRWVDEIFGFRRNARRAERVAVLGSIAGSRAEGAELVTARARQMLTESLRAAIADGIADGTFRVDSPDLASDLVAAVVLHAAGLSTPGTSTSGIDQATTTDFCLRALGFVGD